EPARTVQYAQYGVPLALALALDLGAQTMARFILAHQSGEAALGAYAAAFGLTRAIDLMFIGLSGALAPVLYAAYEDHGARAARDAGRRVFNAYTAIAAPAAVGLTLMAAPLSAVLVGPDLRDEAALVLPWLSLAALVTGFNVYYWSEAFQLGHKTGL